jgi:predicted NAD/FAD-binding protein
MNDLQLIPAEKHGNLFMTINPPSPPSPSHVLGHYSYSHPVQTTDAVRAQGRIVHLNGSATAKGRHRAFAGAWTNYGFHEHGFTAGLRAAAALPGVKLPFRIADADADCGVPHAGVVARVFDVLDVLRAYVVFIIGAVLLFVAWPVGKKGT